MERTSAPWAAHGHFDFHFTNLQMFLSALHFTIISEDFRGFLEKDLFEMSALISLEQSARLNW